MSYKQGIAIGSSLASMGGMVAGTMRQSRDDALKAEKFNWEKKKYDQDQEADQVAAILKEKKEKGEDADLSQFGPVARFKGAGRFAEYQAKERRNSAEGQRLEKEKMGMSLQRINNIKKRFLSAKEQGDMEGVEAAALDFVHHSRNGIKAVEDLGNGKILLKNLDGTEREIDKPTIEQMEAAMSAYTDPAHVQNKLKEQKWIQEHNSQAKEKAQLWKNDKGQEIVVTQGYIDPNTRQYVNLYMDAATDQPLTEEQVRQGGYQSLSIAKDRADFAKADYDTQRANVGQSILFQPDPDSIKRTAKGFIGKTGGGQIVNISDDQAKEMMPLEESKYGTVQNEQGEYVHVKKPGKYEQKGVIGTGVKAPSKSGGDNKVYTVKNPVTGTESQESGKDIRKNLKEAKAMLKDVKDEKGNSFIIPDYESFMKASDKEKETVLGRIQRLASDPERSHEVRGLAGTVLGYLNALGLTAVGKKKGGGKKQSWRDFLEQSETDKPEQAAVLGN